MRFVFPLSIVLVACAPATGVQDSAVQVDTADALERDASPDEAPVDAPSEASTPEAGPDALSCTTDNDRDGHVSRACGGDDCDDDNARVHPGQVPHCDRELVDSNCDGTPDAMQALLRNMRCNAEYSEVSGGMGPDGRTIVCTTSDPMPTCKACQGSGASERCICWNTGPMTARSCAP